MSRPLVVFTDDTIHSAAADRLRETCELRILPGSYPAEALLAETCGNASAILARMGVVTRRVIESAPQLRIIARHGIGVDAVDLDAATEYGIPVTTTGSINAGAVAEYAFAMLLGLARKIPEAHESMRRGVWSRENLIGYELAGKTMGIIGLGAIGTFVARQALGFRMKVIAQDPASRPPADLDIEMTDREDLLRRSDVVSLHMRLTEDTRRTLDAKSIAKLKPGVLVVNTARGELIHEAALIDGLRSGHIGGAAIDVYEQEPLPVDSPLRSMPNVLLSPHVAAQTEESRKLVAIAAAEAILEAIAGRRPKYVYNPAAYEAGRKPAASAV